MGVRVGVTKAPFFYFLIKEISYLKKYLIDSFNHIQFDKHCHSSVAGTWNLIVDHCVDKFAKLGKLRHRWNWLSNPKNRSQNCWWSTSKMYEKIKKHVAISLKFMAYIISINSWCDRHVPWLQNHCDYHLSIQFFSKNPSIPNTW